MEKIYVESSVISVITSRPSRDYEKYSEQLATWHFWDYAARRYKIFISAAVVDEIAKGDAEAIPDRLELAESIEKLPLNEATIRLAEKFVKAASSQKSGGRRAAHRRGHGPQGRLPAFVEHEAYSQ